MNEGVGERMERHDVRKLALQQRRDTVEDLLGIEDLDEQRAAALIMTARAPWFEALEQGGDAR